MNRLQIESWASTIIDQVIKQQPFEDSRVELKSEWPSDTYEASRQIAGLANAALGQPVMWIIGIHERKGILGCKLEELSTWWSQVISHFDGSIPELTDITFRESETGNILKLLCFSTEGAPYVIRSKLNGQPTYVIWWREGTSLRQARRSDIIKILAPVQLLPKVEILQCSLRASVSGPKTARNASVYREGLNWRFHAKLYITPPDERRVVLPFHLCKINVISDGFQNQIPKLDFTLKSSIATYKTGAGFVPFENKFTSSEAIITAPGMWEIWEDKHSGYLTGSIDETIEISIKLQPANSDFAVIVHKRLISKKGNFGALASMLWALP